MPRFSRLSLCLSLALSYTHIHALSLQRGVLSLSLSPASPTSAARLISLLCSPSSLCTFTVYWLFTLSVGCSLCLFFAPKCSSIQLSHVFLISLFPSLCFFCPSLFHRISTTLPLLSFPTLSLARYFSHSINQPHSHLSHDMIPPTPPLSLLVSRGQRLDSGHLIVPLVSLVQRGPHENKGKLFGLFFLHSWNVALLPMR